MTRERREDRGVGEPAQVLLEFFSFFLNMANLQLGWPRSPGARGRSAHTSSQLPSAAAGL